MIIKENMKKEKKLERGNKRMMNLLPVCVYLLHVPLRGILVLPVAAGLAGRAEQQGRQFVHPFDAGRRRGRRWA